MLGPHEAGGRSPPLTRRSGWWAEPGAGSALMMIWTCLCPVLAAHRRAGRKPKKSPLSSISFFRAMFYSEEMFRVSSPETAS